MSEMYVKMGRIDEAEKLAARAARIRELNLRPERGQPASGDKPERDPEATGEPPSQGD